MRLIRWPSVLVLIALGALAADAWTWDEVEGARSGVQVLTAASTLVLIATMREMSDVQAQRFLIGVWLYLVGLIVSASIGLFDPLGRRAGSPFIYSVPIFASQSWLVVRWERSAVDRKLMAIASLLLVVWLLLATGLLPTDE